MSKTPTKTPAEEPEAPPLLVSHPLHVVALDVDGVILNLDHAARRLLHKIEGVSVESTATYDFGQAWGFEPDWFERNKFWHKIWQTPLQAFPDVGVLDELGQWVDIHLVSHRPKGPAKNALRRDLRALNLEFLFTKVHTVEEKQDKQAILDEIKADLYVDDHLETLLQLERPAIKLLRSRPYNQSQDLGNHYTRIFSLHKVLTYV